MNFTPNHVFRQIGLGQSIPRRNASRRQPRERRLTYETLEGRWVLSAVPILTVQGFEPTASGFIADFSQDIATGDLNLYDVEAEIFGPSDITFVGDSVGEVRGSLVVEANRATFIATGGPLSADTYTVTLRSAANGFQMATGQLLDGDENGTPGDDYVKTFTIDAVQPVVVSLPDFSRGAGQPVNMPAYEIGLPLTLTDNRVDGYDVETVDLKIQYNPDLLTISGAVAGPDAPGAVVGLITGPGSVELTVSSLPPLPSGPAAIVTLTAEVPTSASYGAVHVVDVQDLSINEAAIHATADDAIHMANYVGDTTGNGSYSGLDVQRLTRVVVGLDAGFAALPTIDPRIVGDVTGNGGLSSLDLQRLTMHVVGMGTAEIPSLPEPLRLDRLSGAGSESDVQSSSRQAPTVATAGGQSKSVTSDEVAVLHEPTFETVHLPGNVLDSTRNKTVQTGGGGAGHDPFDAPFAWQDEESDSFAKDVVPIEDFALNDLLDAAIVDQAFGSLGPA